LFDILSFMRDYCPTPDAVVGLIQTQFASAPSKETVRKWFARKSVPSEWLPVLFYCVEQKKGKALKLKKYIGEEPVHVDVFG
jgi:hypothetical protein